MTKYIFVAGGVCSSLGKGVTAASIARILASPTLKIGIKKIDPYLNMHAGNMDPFEHGEVFVTEDGYETDLDIGYYERVGNIKCSKNSSITAGLVYSSLNEDERNGKYRGDTIQVVPHITDKIIEKITLDSEQYDIVICEIGGTIGDMEIQPFLEAIRQMKMTYPSIFIMVTLVPYINSAKEFKTKPTQHAARTLLSCGIQPDIIVTRSAISISEKETKKILALCNTNSIYQCVDTKCIYSVAISLFDQKVHTKIFKLFKLKHSTPELNYICMYVDKFYANQHKDTVKIALVSKYSGDAYKSVYQAIEHASVKIGCNTEIVPIDARELETEKFYTKHIESLKSVNCILIPGGFGYSGFEGKVIAARFAIKNGIPILGICYGMQAMVLAALKIYKNIDAVSEEHKNACNNSDAKIAIKQKNAALSCGGQTVYLDNSSIVSSMYKSDTALERFRHRYHVIPDLKDTLKDTPFRFVGGSSNNCMSIIEAKDKKFEIGVQYHPELTSKPEIAHPLFYNLIKVARCSLKPQYKTNNDFKIALFTGYADTMNPMYTAISESQQAPYVEIITPEAVSGFTQDSIKEFHGVVLHATYGLDFKLLNNIAKLSFNSNTPMLGVNAGVYCVIACVQMVSDSLDIAFDKKPVVVSGINSKSNIEMASVSCNIELNSNIEVIAHCEDNTPAAIKLKSNTFSMGTIFSPELSSDPWPIHNLIEAAFFNYQENKNANQ